MQVSKSLNETILMNEVGFCRATSKLVQNLNGVDLCDDVCKVDDDLDRVPEMDPAVDPRETANALKLGPGVERELDVVGGSEPGLDLGRALRKLDGHVEVVGAQESSGRFGVGRTEGCRRRRIFWIRKPYRSIKFAKRTFDSLVSSNEPGQQNFANSTKILLT